MRYRSYLWFYFPLPSKFSSSGTMLLVYNVFATIDIPTAGGGALGEKAFRTLIDSCLVSASIQPSVIYSL